MSNRNLKNLLVVFGLAAACIVLYFALLRGDAIVAGFRAGMKILTPIVYGIVMAYLLNPVLKVVQPRVTWLMQMSMKDQKKAASIGKGIGIAVSVAFGVLVVTVIFLMIIPELYRSIMSVLAVLPGQVENFVSVAEKELKGDAAWVPMANSALDKLGTFFDDFYNNGLLSMANSLLGYVTTSVITAVKFIINLFVGVMVAIFALKSRETFIAQAKKLLYAVCKPEIANNILDVARHGHQIFGGFLIGKIIDSIIIGVICYVCMLLMDMPYAMLVATFVGTTNIVPIIGPFIGAIPSAFLILLADPIKALYFVIFILILQQVDGNIIGPMILGDATGLNEFWVIVALTLCGGIWGLPGMVIGVPLFATLYYIFKRVVERILRKKNLPQETSEYRDVDSFDRDARTFIRGIDERLAREKAEARNARREKRKEKETEEDAKTGE